MNNKDEIIKKYQEEIAGIIDKVSERDSAFAKEFIDGLAFRNEISKETDRGMVLFGVSRIDNLLGDLLRKKLIGSNTLLKELFNNNGPLATFSAKIRLAYSIGLISKSQHDEIHLLRSLRNLFAHSDKPIDFTNDEAINICNKFTYIMQAPVVVHKMRVASTIWLLHLQLNLEIRNAKKITEKKDYYSGEDKSIIDKRTEAFYMRLKEDLGVKE